MMETGQKAQERDRTADLVLTKDVLYRLSYLGASRAWNAIGAGNGTRTRDPELGRLALYQLSYSRMMVERAGFEPTKPYGGRFTVCSLWPLGNLSAVEKIINLPTAHKKSTHADVCSGAGDRS